MPINSMPLCNKRHSGHVGAWTYHLMRRFVEASGQDATQRRGHELNNLRGEAPAATHEACCRANINSLAQVQILN
jgi:hypothetical protein